ncbi:septum formation family protein [Mycobacterium sp. URHB0021]
MTMPPSNPPPYGQPPPPYGQQPPGPAGQPQPMPYPPPPPPMPFQGPPPGFYPPPPNAPKTTNWWAVVSLIFGVIGGVLISVICGIVGLNKAKQGRGGRGMAIAGLVLSGLWVLVAIAAVAIYFIVGKGTVTATDVKVGDCLKEIPDGTRVLTVETVECEESHAGEVFAVLLMPEGDFPGPSAIEKYQSRCEPALASYSPAAITDDSVQLYVLYPTAETWQQGDRAVTCVATLDPPRTGSIKG